MAVQFGHARFVYNFYRAAREGFYIDTGDDLRYEDCAEHLAGILKADYPWLKEAHSQALQQTLKNLDRAYVNLSMGEKIDKLKYLHRSERRLKIRQRRLSRKQKGSKHRNHARLSVAVLHEKVANQRKDFQHKLSRNLVDHNATLKVTDLSNAEKLAQRFILGQQIWKLTNRRIDMTR